MQIEEERDPVRRIRKRVVRNGVPIDGTKIPSIEAAVIVEHYADEDTRSAAGRPLHGHSSILEHLPSHLQQEPVLWIGAACLARRDPEEAPIDSIDVVQ